jgi:hypothetical protein
MTLATSQARKPKTNAAPVLREASKPVNLGRHQRNCTVCAHAKREEIEADFLNWKRPALIAKEYRLADRQNVYRHAYALGLFERRRRNLRAALEAIIEKASEVDVNAAAVVSAIQAYAKINAQGQWVDHSEHVNLNELFERMTREEMETYAKDGTLPRWFSQTVTVTPANSQREEKP